MAEVAYLRDVSGGVDLSLAQVLDRATASDLSGAMVIGMREDGSLYFETSILDGDQTVWLLEKVKHLILSASFRGDEATEARR